MSKWVTLTVSESARERFYDFREKFGFTSNDNAINFLLSVFNVFEDGNEDIEGILDDEAGVVIQSHSLKKQDYVHLDGTRVVMLPEGDEEVAAYTMLDESNHTEGAVYCPACWSEIFTYELDERYPSLDGVFKNAGAYCPVCETTRDAFTLIVRSGWVDDKPSDEIYPGAQRYWIARILHHGISNSVFVDKVSSYQSVVEDRGDQWLPDPHEWLDIDGLKYVGDVTPKDYMVFMKRYVENLNEFGGETNVSNAFYDQQTPSGCCNISEEHIHVSADSGVALANDIEVLTSGWESIEAKVRKDNGRFDRFDDDQESFIVEVDGIRESGDVTMDVSESDKDAFDDAD